MQAAPSTSVPAIRVAVIVGAIVAVLGSVAAFKLMSVREQEMLRYLACTQNRSRDCEPSLFWVLAGLAKPDARGRLATQEPVGEGKRVTRTSDDAPLLTSLKPEGFVPEGTGYQVALNGRVTLTATIEKAKRVEARLRPTASSTAEDVLVHELSTVAGKDDLYEASFAWTEARSGDLEIRAYAENPSERASLFIPLRVETVAKPK